MTDCKTPRICSNCKHWALGRLMELPVGVCDHPDVKAALVKLNKRIVSTRHDDLCPFDRHEYTNDEHKITPPTFLRSVG